MTVAEYKCQATTAIDGKQGTSGFVTGRGSCTDPLGLDTGWSHSSSLVTLPVVPLYSVVYGITQGSVPTGQVYWNHWMAMDILFAVNTVIQCQVIREDVCLWNVADVSCNRKYWVVTISINLPKISLLGLGLSGLLLVVMVEFTLRGKVRVFII